MGEWLNFQAPKCMKVQFLARLKCASFETG